jgi:ATP-dependent Clp protease ATP-binding subunit ClpC
MSNDERPSPTPRYFKILDDSTELARRMGHSYVGVEHLFLAIIRDRAAVPTQVLAGLIDVERVEASLREEMASYGYNGEPPAGAVWLPLSELPDLLPALANCVAPDVTYGFNVVGDRAWILVHEPGNTEEAIASARAEVARERASGA